MGAKLYAVGENSYYNALINDLEEAWHVECFTNPNYDFYNDHNREECEKCFYENELYEFTDAEREYILRLMGY